MCTKKILLRIFVLNAEQNFRIKIISFEMKDLDGTLELVFIKV